MNFETPLSQSCREMTQRAGRSPTYPQVWAAVASGKLPAKRVGTKYFINIEDAMRHFGLTEKVAA